MANFWDTKTTTPTKPQSSGGFWDTPIPSAPSNSFNLTNQNFNIGGTTTPAFSKTNITPISVGKSAGEFVKSRGQSLLRGFGATGSLINSIAQSGMSALQGKGFTPITSDFRPEGQFQQELYAADKPFNFSTVGGEFPFVDENSKIAPFVGFAGVLGDLIPGGTSVKQASTILKNLNKTDDVVKTLKRVGQFSDEVLGSIVPKITSLTDEKQIFSLIENGLKESKQARQLSKEAGLLMQPTSIVKPLEETISAIEQVKKSSLDESVLQASDYVKQMVKVREAERVADTPGLLAKTKSFLASTKAKLVDFAAPIEDVLASTLKKSKMSLLPENNIKNQIDRVLRSPTLAGQFAEDGGIVDVLKKVSNPDALDQYLIAKHAIELDTRGITTGRDLAKDANLIKVLGPEYEQYAKTVSTYSQRLLDYTTESGLISKETADMLKARYPDYVPFDRVFSEMEKAGGITPATKGVASLSKQTVVQTIKGSERAIESPLESLLAKTNDAFKQGEKNIAGRLLASYEKLPGNPFELVPLRTTENVIKRIELYSEAKDLKPLQRKAGEILARNTKELSKLKTEVNNLNKQGLKEYLKAKPQSSLPTKVSSTQIKNIPAKEDIVAFDKYDIPTRMIREGSPEKNIVTDTLVVLNRKEAKAYIEELIQNRNIDLEAIKRKIATRDPKVVSLIDQVSKMREEFLGIKELRGGIIDEARLLRDAESKGKSTITFFDNGVKNIFETTPEVAAAAKALNVQQLNVLGKILAFPIRVAKVGITGINPSFIAANLARDQVGAFVNADKGLRSSLLNPSNFVRSLFSAVAHDDLYKEMIRAGGGGTSFDLYRNQVGTTVKQIRATRTPLRAAFYTVTHPGQLLRAVENIVGRAEELTRIQQYRGTKEALISKGMDVKNAGIEGARMAREASVNFARRGEWGAVLNNAFLYLNAGIQGSRTLVRNLKDKPVQTATKIVVSTMVPMAVATAWNLSDPERKKIYDDIPEYEKENNFIYIPDGATKDDRGRWNVIKIPISQNINNLLNMVRRPIEASHGLDPVGFGDFAKSIIGTVSPVAPTKGSIFSTLTPQAIKPTLEGYMNKSIFTNVPQVSQGLERLPIDKQIKPGTSATAVQIGNTLNISPIKVQEWIKGTFGGSGLQALNFVDKVQAKLGNITPEQIGGQDVLEAITARFVKAQGGAIANQEYEAQKIADTIKAGVRADFKKNVYEKVQVLKVGGNEEGALEIVNSLSDDEYDMYKNIRSSEKAKNTEKLRNLLIRDPKSGVAYVRSQNEEEQERLLKVLTDTEYKLYESGK